MKATLYACYDSTYTHLGLVIIAELIIICTLSGTGIRGLMSGMASLPQGNQELLVVNDEKLEDPGELVG